MLFGMGLTLTPEEDGMLKDVIEPCFAALGLANDYFSFDREYSERQDSGGSSMTNAVWLYMQWHDVSVDEAKERVRQLTIGYEDEFVTRRDTFLNDWSSSSPKLRKYLAGLSQQVIGNVAWSLRCPRYNPHRRYDANAGVENLFDCRGDAPTVGDLQEASRQQRPIRRQDQRRDSARGSPGSSSPRSCRRR